MALTGVRADVDQAKVSGLLQARQPDILDAGDPEQIERFEARVRGASVTVVLLAGEDPTQGLLRDLAAEAMHRHLISVYSRILPDSVPREYRHEGASAQ